MRALITGAAGFLGSHLCDRLLQEGFSVVGMDNFITGNPDNLAHLAGHESFSFIRHDVSSFIFVPGKLKFVLHFASPASPNAGSPFGYVNLPIQTMKAEHSALTIRSELPGKTRPVSCLLPPARSTEIRSNTRRTNLLGSCRPDWDPLGIRRSETLCRSPDDGISPLSWHRYQYRAHLQHVRPAHAPGRRPCSAELLNPGPFREAADGLR